MEREEDLGTRRAGGVEIHGSRQQPINRAAERKVFWSGSAGRRAGWKMGVDSPDELRSAHDISASFVASTPARTCRCGDWRSTQPPAGAHSSAWCKSRTCSRCFSAGSHPTTQSSWSTTATAANAGCPALAIPLWSRMASGKLGWPQDPAAPTNQGHLRWQPREAGLFPEPGVVAPGQTWVMYADEACMEAIVANLKGEVVEWVVALHPMTRGLLS